MHPLISFVALRMRIETTCEAREKNVQKETPVCCC